MRHNAGVTKLNRQLNEDILNLLNIESILQHIHTQRLNWKDTPTEWTETEY